jgi:hypothetical protein
VTPKLHNNWLLLDPSLREALRTPIRINKIPPGKRRQAIEAAEVAKRERALFALYHIPEDWPALDRWEWLARHLAGELFAGCRVMTKGLGGPSRAYASALADRRRPVFEKFDQYLADNPGLDQIQAAKTFIEMNRPICLRVRLTHHDSFLRRYRNSKATV